MAAVDIPKKSTNSSVDQTRRRLLDAAAHTFSRDGIQGATTRGIAKEAGVNEVTLFRHFKSKEQLLGAVVEKGLSSEIDLMNAQGSWAEHFRENLTRYARHYYEHLEGKGAFARAIISEFRELPHSTQAMIINAVRPVRDRLIGILREAQSAGVVRPDLDAECAIDALKNSLYAAVLRTSSCLPRNYTTEEYIDSVVEIFYRGLAA
jgi:AcrR family transcriptional regulator